MSEKKQDPKKKRKSGKYQFRISSEKREISKDTVVSSSKRSSIGTKVKKKVSSKKKSDKK